MSSEKILVVEDEAAIAELLIYNLGKEGYQLRHAASGETGLRAAREWRPDLVLLDLMLPGIDGLTVCRRLKSDAETARIPVVMLTAKGEESDIVVGLELGADDYIVKPFSNKILTARLRAALRRNRENPEDASNAICSGPLRLDRNTRTAELGGEPLELTCSEFDILATLAARPGWVFTRGRIINAVRGGDYPVTERSIDVQIVGLRRKLAKRADLIETMRGVGYRFNPDAPERTA